MSCDGVRYLRVICRGMKGSRDGRIAVMRSTSNREMKGDVVVVIDGGGSSTGEIAISAEARR